MRRSTSITVKPKKGPRTPMAYCYHRDLIHLESYLEKVHKGDSRRLKGGARKHWQCLSLKTRAKIIDRINQRMFRDMIYNDLKKCLKASMIEDGTYAKRISASARCVQLYGHLVA